MKQVLLIDAAPQFREFLKEKLQSEKIQVETTAGRRDAFTRLITTLADLIIYDVNGSLEDLEDFLVKKYNDPNARRIPIIICGPVIQRSKVATLAQYGVVKYFNKPIKFDIFFDSISKILKENFSLDDTPSVVELHVNGNIIFLEIAEGLNRDKIALIKYKLPEIVESNKINNPKLIVMMTNLQLSYVDGANLDYLFDNIIFSNKIPKKNIKVLSLESFTKDFIEGHPQYYGIETATSLTDVLNSLVDTSAGTDYDVVSDKILSSDDSTTQGSIEMRFGNDMGGITENDNDKGNILKVAIVDDDPVTRKLLQASYSTISAECILFSNGKDFIAAIQKKLTFDVLILDLYIPDVNGFDILKTLQKFNYTVPVIIYSQATQKESVIQALSLGAKSYIVKPQKPEVLLQKTVEVLHSKL